MTVRLLLEGRPGAGKTTVAARLADLLAERGVEVQGFVTQELREYGRRVGFEVETIDGERATLAHVSFAGPPRVGKYGVDLEALERVALPALEKPARGAVVLIDELGKMETAWSASATQCRACSTRRSTSLPLSTSSAIRSPTS